jgi:hypothetical protein
MSFDLRTSEIVPLESLLPPHSPNGNAPRPAKAAVAAAAPTAPAAAPPTAVPARSVEAVSAPAAKAAPAQAAARSTTPAPGLRPNRVQWRGWIDCNPEVRRSNSGKDFCAVRVTQEVLNTQRQPMVQAVDVVLFHAAARDFVAAYRKGDFIEVNGEFHVRKWRDKHGHEHLDVNLHPSEEIALISRPRQMA